MMNMISGGRSCRILLIESKLAKSFSLIYCRSSWVMPSPIFLELFLERCRKMRGRY
jgi:hypothetical protein